MSIISWSIVGILAGIAARHLAGSVPKDGLITAMTFGSILTGYTADLDLRGDFVVHFHALTVVAAVVGAAVTAGAGGS